MMLQIRDKSLKITFNFATENAKPQIDATARRGFFFFASSFHPPAAARCTAKLRLRQTARRSPLYRQLASHSARV